MRILHIVAGVPPGGGIAESVPALCRHLRQLGHEVALATLDGPPSEAALAAEAAGVRLVRFAPSWPRALYFSWQMLRGLPALARAADAVHVHGAWTFPVWWGCRCALRVRKPLVMSPQGALNPVYLKHSAWKKRLVGWLDRACLRRAAAVHVTSEAEREWVEAYCDHGVVAMASVKTGAGRAGARAGHAREGKNAERRTLNAQRSTLNAQVGKTGTGRIVVIPNGVEGREVLNCESTKRSSLVHYCESALVERSEVGGRRSEDGFDSTNERMNSRTNELPRDAARTRTVLYLGRLHPLKGLELLVEAWAEVKRSSLVHYCVSALVGEQEATGNTQSAADSGISSGIPTLSTNARMNSRTNELRPWRLVIAGPDEQGTLARLKAQAERLGLHFQNVETVGELDDSIIARSADVLFLDAVYREDKWALLRRADIFVLSSRSENFGIVVGEALACEVPVVMTDVGPWREESARQPVLGMTCCEPWSRNGAIRFVETRADSLATGLAEMMRLSDEERRGRGARGREWIRERFSWEAVARQMLDLYDLLRPRRGRNGECKNGRGAGEGARGACDGGGVREEPGRGHG